MIASRKRRLVEGLVPARFQKSDVRELNLLTSELEELASLLKHETRTRARWVIMQRVQEIMSLIGKGLEE